METKRVPQQTSDWQKQLKQIDEDYFKFVRQRIKEARDERHFTQGQLGKAIHKSGAVISDIERGRTEVSAADLMEIAYVLEKPIKYFFPIRDVPSEEELTTDEWELVLQFRKLDNHPDLRKFLMDEAKKLGEVATTKETGIVTMLLENMINQGEEVQKQEAVGLKDLKKLLERARKRTRKK